MLLLSILSVSAWAVPVQYTHQGRLLDEAGTPVEGEVSISFRLMDDAESGSAVWSEDITVTLTNGFYVAVLGQDEETHPLDSSVLEQAPLWLELTIDGGSAMLPRSPLNSVPYAQMAGVSEDMVGGRVDATDVAVAGSPVIDEEGRWVGAPIQWSDLEGIPSGFADGVDDDTVTVDTDTDTVLSGDEVRAHVDGATLNLGAGSTVDLVPIATVDDTVGAMDCLEGDVLRWDSVSEEWMCSTDLDSSTTIGGESVLTAASGSAVPSGMIAFFAASECPAGWTEFTALQGRFLLGTPDGGTSGDSVGAALGAGESLTTSAVVAHAHNIGGGELGTDSVDLTHSHETGHTHEVDPPPTSSDEAETSGSSGCTSVTDKWNNSGGCHWGASCSSSYSVAACGSGSGTPHSHVTDIPSFASAGPSSTATEISGAPHDHTVTLPDMMSDVSGADVVDITPPYLQLMACIAP